MMTPQQIEAERAWYRHQCRTQHTDAWHTCQSQHAYTPTQRTMAAAEVAYVYERGRLPRWATIIERVETHNNNHIFIWIDPTKIS